MSNEIDSDELDALMRNLGAGTKTEYTLSDAGRVELDEILREFYDTRRESGSSAYGDHYLMAAVLQREGVPVADMDSTQILRYAEQGVLNGKITVYR